jgi:hypothetical protein
MGTIKCTSCGASNQLPEGKASMFCAFCGSNIEKLIEIKNSIQNPLRTKPKISKQKTEKQRDVEPYVDNSGRVTYYYGDKYDAITDEGGELFLIDRGINNLGEIIEWFSDNELSTVLKLKLNNNKINSLIGLERFTNLNELDLSQNLISDFNHFDVVDSSLNLVDFKLNNNKLTSVKNISKFKVLKLNLSDNDLYELDDIPQITTDESFYVKSYCFTINLSNNKN